MNVANYQNNRNYLFLLFDPPLPTFFISLQNLCITCLTYSFRNTAIYSVVLPFNSLMVRELFYKPLISDTPRRKGHKQTKRENLYSETFLCTMSIKALNKCPKAPIF